ncbi:unnamed protein product [Protopolystoma xenopodis]|uniref:Uncharacterized protein n=1 Tax=Protopolystoma xenopodis TaxID=117903 RepID=A0A3S5AEY9_9PLAT|nr:unnamed protein product [Protopolystoma xenopodis]
MHTHTHPLSGASHAQALFEPENGPPNRDDLIDSRQGIRLCGWDISGGQPKWARGMRLRRRRHTAAATCTFFRVSLLSPNCLHSAGGMASQFLAPTE